MSEKPARPIGYFHREVVAAVAVAVALARES